MDILDTRENLNAMVLKHEQQIKDIVAHLLELKQLVTPMIEFKQRRTVDKDEVLKLALETLEQMQEGCNNVIADKLHSDAVDLAKKVRKDCNKLISAIESAHGIKGE